MIKKLIKSLRCIISNKDNISLNFYDLSKIQHKIPRTGVHIIKYNDKYYKVKELG